MYLHDIKISLDHLNSEEVTALVKMKTTITETRRILYPHTWQRPVGLRCRFLAVDINRKHLLDGLDGIIESAKIRRLNTNALWSHLQNVSFRCYGRILYKYKTGLCRTLTDLGPCPCDLSKYLSKVLHNIHCRGVHRRIISNFRTLDAQVSLPDMNLIRIWHHILDILRISLHRE